MLIFISHPDASHQPLLSTRVSLITQRREVIPADTGETTHISAESQLQSVEKVGVLPFQLGHVHEFEQLVGDVSQSGVCMKKISFAIDHSGTIGQYVRKGVHKKNEAKEKVHDRKPKGDRQRK